MEFRILGPVELWVDGQRHDLGRAQTRCVLAVLLLNPNQPVSVDKLIGCVWDGPPPLSARDSLYAHISNLRALFPRVGDEARIPSPRNGRYTLEVDPERIDLFRARRLREQAHVAAQSGDDEGALALYRAAARLCRAEPLADLTGSWAIGIRRNLEEEQLNARLEHIDIELRHGRHAKLVTELTDFSGRFPLNQKLVQNLMEALYGSGRRAEALQAYRDFSHHLHEAIGIDPTADLQEMYLRMLHGDRALLPAPRPRRHDVRPPHNLPHDVRALIGRDSELSDLLTALSNAQPAATGQASPPMVILIDGMPGVGKTAFATHLAHRLIDHYPDGQLYLDLFGFTADQPALSTDMALDRLLRMIGVPARRIPQSPEERAALWQNELRRRRILLFLDNALSHEQIRLLLPGAPGSVALITSRRRLAGLDDGMPRTLDVLSPSSAAQLFQHATGADRHMDERDVTMVVQLCGSLPLALQILGNRIRHHPERSATGLVNRLAQDNRRLAEIRAEDREIATTFAVSYYELSTRQRRMFRQLGLHPGADFTNHAAAAAIGGSILDADRMLDDLLELHLITLPAPGRYRFHDLIRDYARQLAEHDDSKAERRTTVQRILDHYVFTADHANLLINPHRRRIELSGMQPPTDPITFQTAVQAREWFNSEHNNLLSVSHYAAGADWPMYRALFSYTLAQHLEIGGYWETAVGLHDKAVTAWQEIGDDSGAAQALSDLSVILFRTGRYVDALEHAETALAIYRRTADRRAEADLLDHIGQINWHRSEYRESLERLQEANEIFRAVGEPHGEAATLAHIAFSLWHVGRYHEARARLDDALAIFSNFDNLLGRMMTLNNIGDIELRLGHHETALDYYNNAASAGEMSRQHGAIWQNNIGNVLLHTNHPDDAVEHFQKALETYQEIGDRRCETDTLINIGSALLQLGRHVEALGHQQRALGLARDLSERFEQARCLRHIGDVHQHAHRFEEAMENYRAAFDLATRIGDPYEQAQALEGIGAILHHQANHAHARRCWQEALNLYRQLDVPEYRSLESRIQGRPPS